MCFSDECTYILFARFFKLIQFPVWSPEQPIIFVEGNSQWPKKLKVWAEFFGDINFGPLFFEWNLNGDVYHNLIEEYINHLTDLIENAVGLLEMVSYTTMIPTCAFNRTVLLITNIEPGLVKMTWEMDRQTRSYRVATKVT